MVFGKPMRCAKCDKIVGFAEAVHNNEKIYHRECYKCATCQKRLQRGQGLTNEGENYCHHCHAKQFGPQGFKPGVIVSKKAVKKVRMEMQPPFAHSSVDFKKDRSALAKLDAMLKHAEKQAAKTDKDNKKLHYFEVAVFQGTSTAELAEFLKEGNVDVSSWDKTALDLLLEQLQQGRSELGLDTDGNALRVTSVSKALVYDDVHDVVLFNPLNTFESGALGDDVSKKLQEKQVHDNALGDLQRNMYPSVLEMLQVSLDLGAPLVDLDDVLSFEDLGFRSISAAGNKTHTIKAQKSKGVVNVEIPGALVLEAPFPTLSETPAAAGARVFTTRFGMKHATPRIFSRQVHKTVKTHQSTRFPGLNTEYHIYYILLKKQLVTPLQKTLPLGKVTPVKLSDNKVSKTGMNTNWYVWISRSNKTPADVLKELQNAYNGDKRVSWIVGEVDFKGQLAKAMGEVMLDEIKALDQWDS